jgi:hypothetical protein
MASTYGTIAADLAKVDDFELDGLSRTAADRF